MPRVIPGVFTPIHGARDVGAVSFVTKADFRRKVLEAEGPVAVEFMSFACGYCRRANPLVHDVAKDLGGTVKVFQVNVPQQQALSAEYGITATPTFIMFQNGREVGRSRGVEISEEGIRRAITAPFGLR